MELIYAWIEKFRNYQEVELNFSNKFNIKYNKPNNNIEIVSNNSCISIYPEYITNINAVVGKNSVGKTNLLDVLGLKIDDRNNNNAEFETRYKKRVKVLVFLYRMILRPKLSMQFIFLSTIWGKMIMTKIYFALRAMILRVLQI